MTLQQLKYVDAVATYGSLSEASRRVFVTQPSLTEAIRTLEEELRIAIFSRTSRGVTVLDGQGWYTKQERKVLVVLAKKRESTTIFRIIQSIDRKVALDDIAVAKGIDFDELLDEVEAIVYSGTKLNIDYFIEEVMDDEHINDIFLYFKESETDNLDAALEELGNEYSEEEIRLVRIKFISEMAN